MNDWSAIICAASMSILAVGAHADDAVGTSAPESQASTSSGIAASPATGEGEAAVIEAGGPAPGAPTGSSATVPPANRMMQEIVVTAQKREEALQDVPISIQAFNGEGLAARGVESTAELPRITPGLTITTQVGYTVTYLRGLGSDAFLFADPSVVNYTDGVYYPFPLGQTTNFGDVERVEVLKGPQGTLFGRNAIGGAVNVITRDPSLKELEVRAKVGYGSWDTYNTRGSISIPLTDSLAVSVSGLYFYGDPYIDGRVNTVSVPGGEPLNQETGGAVRAKVLWAPTDWMKANLSAYHLGQSGTGTLYSVNVEPSVLGRTAGIDAEDPYHGVNNEDIFYNESIRTYSGQVQFFTGWFDVKLFGSDQYVEVDQNYDFDGSQAPLVYFEIDPGSSDVQTGEFQILSNESSWGSDWLQWIGGAYYFKSRAGFDKLILRAASTNLAQGTIYGLPLVPDEVQQAVLGLGLPVPTGDIETVSLLGTESIAFFAQATATMGEHFALTLGGRYQDEERKVLRTTGGLRLASGQLANYYDASYRTNPDLKDTTYAFSPKVTLQFFPRLEMLGNDAQVYLTWQKATKSATYNVINFLDFNPEEVLAEKIEAYELGFKTTLFDGLAQLNTAAFHYTIHNPQVQVVSIFNGGVVSFENAQEAKVRGVDFDLLAQLLPSIDEGLVLTLNGAYLHTEYTEYTNGSGFNELGVYTTNQDFSGNKVVRSPKYSGAIALSQTLGTPFGTLEAAADYYYNDGFYYRPENTAVSKENSYGVLGARVSLLIDATGLRVTAFARNVTDAHYNYSRFITDFGALDARAPLSQYGIELEYEFE